MSTKDEHASDNESDDVGSEVVQEEDEISFSGSAIFSKAITSVESTVPSDILEFM